MGGLADRIFSLFYQSLGRRPPPDPARVEEEEVEDDDEGIVEEWLKTLNDRKGYDDMEEEEEEKTGANFGDSQDWPEDRNQKEIHEEDIQFVSLKYFPSGHRCRWNIISPSTGVLGRRLAPHGQIRRH